MSKPLIFKVRYGYNANDFVLINNTADLEKALYAKIEKIPVTLGGKFISGTEIKEIAPDVHSYTGWHRSYEAVSGDDFAQIERDVPKVAFDLIQACMERVNQLLLGDRVEEIGKVSLPPDKLLLNAKKHE